MFFDDDDAEDQQQQGQTGQGFDIEGGLVAGMFKAFFMIMLVLFLAIVLAGVVGYKAAYAATYDYVSDVTPGRDRICGRVTPVLDLRVPEPADGSSRYEWRERYQVVTCAGHNPAVSCPAPLVQWHHMIGGNEGGSHGATYRDFICYDMTVPPVPAGEPALRPCYGEGGQPCNGIADYWQGRWYGTWRPGYTPPGCPPGTALRQENSMATIGRVRYTCA